MLVGLLGVLVGRLAMRVRRHRVFLGLFVLSLFVMMNGLTVMVRRCLVMPGSRVVVLAGGVFHGHGWSFS
jgi:hypothetical protein